MARTAEQLRQLLLAHERKNIITIEQFVLAFSLLLNLLLCIFIYTSQSEHSDVKITQEKTIHWTSRAAELAEKVSELECSGHGTAFIDTGSCECNSCFTGVDCSQKLPNCAANSDGGDPLFLQPFWDVNAEAGAVMVAPSYRMSYSADGERTMKHLEQQIRRLHAFVGNAVTEGRYIVLGTGSMQLINAAVASLAGGQPSTALVVSRVPYYGAYQSQTQFFETNKYKWEGDAMEASKNYQNNNTTYIEIIGAPSNPDFSMQKAVMKGALTIYDRAYYWPHYSPITEAVDDDLTLFTLSKITGHAGSRLGWAIVKDRAVYERMQLYVGTNIIAVSHETQLRAWKLLEAVVDGYVAKKRISAPTKTRTPEMFAQEQRIFHFADSVMKSRWQRLQQVFQMSQRFSLLTVVEPQPCTFFKTTRISSPAYAWVMCKIDLNCYQTFEEAGILGRDGFGANSSYVRFTLLRGNDDFDHFIERLTTLVSKA